MIERRQFLRKSLTSVAAGFFARTTFPFAWAQSGNPDARIEVLLNEPLGTISPNIYGHFTENLSGVIYDGIWVGENSKVPNVDGIRKELIEQMRKIKASGHALSRRMFCRQLRLARWHRPRGQAPAAHELLGRRVRPARRPPTHRYDPNQFGTNEFVHFCRLIGSEPYLAANVRSLPAEEFYRWVEYCNSPAGSTTSGRHARMPADSKSRSTCATGAWETNRGDAAEILRRRNMPWNSGASRPGSRASDRSCRLSRSGPNVDDWAWTRGFFEAIARKGRGQFTRGLWSGPFITTRGT